MKLKTIVKQTIKSSTALVIVLGAVFLIYPPESHKAHQWLLQSNEHGSLAKSSVNISEAKPQAFSSKLVFHAPIKPMITETIISNSPGIIKKLLKNNMDWVKSGDRLAEIDTPQEREKLIERAIKFAINKDLMEKSDKKHTQNIELYDKGMISLEEKEKSQQELANNKINFIQAKLHLSLSAELFNIQPEIIENLSLINDEALNMLINSKPLLYLTAKSSGYFLIYENNSKDNKNAGTIYREGMKIEADNAIGGLAEYDRFKISLEIKPNDSHFIHQGDQVSITLPYQNQCQFEGYIEKYNDNVLQKNKSDEDIFIAEIVFHSHDKSCKPIIGSKAHVMINTQTQTLTSIPWRAIHTIDDQHYVKVYNQSTMITEKRKINVIETDHQHIGVENINSGEQVVSDYFSTELDQNH